MHRDDPLVYEFEALTQAVIIATENDHHMFMSAPMFSEDQYRGKHMLHLKAKELLRKIDELLTEENIVVPDCVTVNDQQEAIKELSEAVLYASEVFTKYVALHLQKGTMDGVNKAKDNMQHVTKMIDAYNKANQK